MTHTPEIIEEDLPISPRAQELVHQVAVTKFRSQAKKLGGATLFKECRAGGISLDEVAIITSEIDAKVTRLTADPNAAPADIPEAPQPEVTTEAWSPTAGVTDEGVERDRDWAERAYKD